MNDRQHGHAQLAKEPALLRLIRQMLEAQGVVDAPDPLFGGAPPERTPEEELAQLSTLAIGAPEGV